MGPKFLLFDFFSFTLCTLCTSRKKTRPPAPLHQQQHLFFHFYRECLSPCLLLPTKRCTAKISRRPVDKGGLAPGGGCRNRCRGDALAPHRRCVACLLACVRGWSAAAAGAGADAVGRPTRSLTDGRLFWLLLDNICLSLPLSSQIGTVSKRWWISHRDGGGSVDWAISDAFFPYKVPGQATPARTCLNVLSAQAVSDDCCLVDDALTFGLSVTHAAARFFFCRLVFIFRKMVSYYTRK